MACRYTLEQFVEKARKIHHDRYDYSLVKYVNSHTKIKIACAVHGYFFQTPGAHINQRQGCSKCSGKYRLSNKEFVEKAKNIHNGKYVYSLVNYINNYTKVKIICLLHGEFFQTPNNHLQNHGCPTCARNAAFLSIEEFIKRANQVHDFKYSYKNMCYVKTSVEVSITCFIHGEFEQTPNNHLSGQGCPKCGIAARTLTTSEFIKKANNIHDNKYSYNLVDYKHSFIKVKIVCSIHGPFKQLPSNHLLGHGCQYCASEKMLGAYSRGHFKLYPEKENTPGILYLVIIDNSFIKIGITTRCADDRFKTEKELKGKIVILFEKEMFLSQAFLLEQEILDIFHEYQCIPTITFGGRTECFNLNAKQLILNHINH